MKSDDFGVSAKTTPRQDKYASIAHFLVLTSYSSILVYVCIHMFTFFVGSWYMCITRFNPFFHRTHLLISFPFCMFAVHVCIPHVELIHTLDYFSAQFLNFFFIASTPLKSTFSHCCKYCVSLLMLFLNTFRIQPLHITSTAGTLAKVANITCEETV